MKIFLSQVYAKHQIQRLAHNSATPCAKYEPPTLEIAWKHFVILDLYETENSEPLLYPSYTQPRNLNLQHLNLQNSTSRIQNKNTIRIERNIGKHMKNLSQWKVGSFESHVFSIFKWLWLTENSMFERFEKKIRFPLYCNMS